MEDRTLDKTDPNPLDGFADAVDEAIDAVRDRGSLLNFLEGVLGSIADVQIVHKGRTWRLTDPALPHSAARAWLRGVVREFEELAK